MTLFSFKQVIDANEDISKLSVKFDDFRDFIFSKYSVVWCQGNRPLSGLSINYTSVIPITSTRFSQCWCEVKKQLKIWSIYSNAISNSWNSLSLYVHVFNTCMYVFIKKYKIDRFTINELYHYIYTCMLLYMILFITLWTCTWSFFNRVCISIVLFILIHKILCTLF